MSFRDWFGVSTREVVGTASNNSAHTKCPLTLSGRTQTYELVTAVQKGQDIIFSCILK